MKTLFSSLIIVLAFAGIPCYSQTTQCDNHQPMSQVAPVASVVTPVMDNQNNSVSNVTVYLLAPFRMMLTFGPPDYWPNLKQIVVDGQVYYILVVSTPIVIAQQL